MDKQYLTPNEASYVDDAPAFPPESAWPEMWVSGKSKCVEDEIAFSPADTFENGQVPANTLRDWFKSGLVVSVNVIPGAGSKEGRSVQIECMIMGLTTTGAPCWKHYSHGGFVTVASDDDVAILIRNITGK